jgi:beta-lactamase class A
MKSVIMEVIMGKRAIIFALAFCVLPVAAAAADAKAAVLERKFEAGLRAVADGLDGVMGYRIRDIKTGKTYALNEDEVFPQASSIKIAVLFEAFKRAEEGSLKLDEPLAVAPDRKVAGNGVLVHLSDPALKLSVRDLCVLMVVLSDNTATNLLIDRVGMEAVNKRLDGLGLPRTRLRRRMMDLKAAAEGRENVSTPREMTTLLEKIWSGDVLKDPFRKDLIEILSIEKDSPLRTGVLAVAEDVAVAEKPGELEAVRCDSGIVLLPDRPYVIAVMTTYLKHDGDGNPAIAAVSRLAFEHFLRLKRSSDLGRVVSMK